MLTPQERIRAQLQELFPLTSLSENLASSNQIIDQNELDTWLEPIIKKSTEEGWRTCCYSPDKGKTIKIVYYDIIEKFKEEKNFIVKEGNEYLGA